MSKKISVLGSGLSSLAASCYLAQQGNQVTVYEKNSHLGGRLRVFEKDGFKFDMGPSWYWMPDVFEKFYNDFGFKTEDFYELIRLDPGYQVIFEDQSSIPIGAKMEEIYKVFEQEEPGSSVFLKKFISKAENNYNIAIKDLVYKPGESIFELITGKTIVNVNQFFSTIAKDVRKHIKSDKLRQILEFPVLFLGSKAANTPSFYSFMNFADFGLGTWHPKGGMHQIVKAFLKIGESLGVVYHTDAAVNKIVVDHGVVKGIEIKDQFIPSDVVLSGADYHHTEQLLDSQYKQYSEKYWDKKTFAPSSLLFYVGFDKRVGKVLHHNLFFDTDFERHAESIYDSQEWPTEPLFYANFPSVSDPEFAPQGKDGGFFLIPVAPGLEDNGDTHERYFNEILSRLEKFCGEDLKDHILFRETFSIRDFIKDYNSYKGNAYGLANTLMQTAILRPKLASKKVKNLYFTGQLTVPGPGLPPAIISGKVVSELILTS
ncbi:MAG: phytoene desaturase family protein [Flavobacteriaceae bacterium]